MLTEDEELIAAAIAAGVCSGGKSKLSPAKAAHPAKQQIQPYFKHLEHRNFIIMGR